jgi:parallel beta-helix repeat protein
VVADYQLAADLGPCAGHGLRVASGVTLDCRQHVIRGPGSQSQHYGVYLGTGTTSATVRHCQVTGFRHGIRLRQAHGNRLIDNVAHHNGDATAHIGYGIDVADGSTANLLQGNRVHHNADEGIHIGAGSHRNTLLANQVHDNFRENLYVLRAEGGVFRDNVTRGGGNSLLLKHASFHRFEGNRFYDRTALIRGDSHDNQFSGNAFIAAGLHFEALEEDATLTRPMRNLVSGGTIVGANVCLRFTGAAGNVVRAVRFDGCGDEVLAAGLKARTENTLIDMRLNPGRFSLRGKALIHVGWPLEVLVRDAAGTALGGARVQGFDVRDTPVFEAVTGADGKIPTQDVLQYTHNGLAPISHNPYTLRVTTQHATAVREVIVDGPKAIVISLPQSGR